MSTKLLIDELLKNSISSVWDEAKFEWELIDIEHTKEPDTCTCGHYPICELCWIKNNKTKSVALVGNHCIKQFINRSDKIFKCFSRLRKKNDSSLNSETIEFAFEKNLINNWEKDFYFNIWRKRNLTTKQEDKKKQINKKILNYIQKNKRKNV